MSATVFSLEIANQVVQRCKLSKVVLYGLGQLLISMNIYLLEIALEVYSLIILKLVLPQNIPRTTRSHVIKSAHAHLDVMG